MMGLRQESNLLRKEGIDDGVEAGVEEGEAGGAGHQTLHQVLPVEAAPDVLLPGHVLLVHCDGTTCSTHSTHSTHRAHTPGVKGLNGPQASAAPADFRQKGGAPRFRSEWPTQETCWKNEIFSKKAE